MTKVGGVVDDHLIVNVVVDDVVRRRVDLRWRDHPIRHRQVLGDRQHERDQRRLRRRQIHEIDWRRRQENEWRGRRRRKVEVRIVERQDRPFDIDDFVGRQGYEDFLAAYPGDPMAPRVRAIVAARREAITWRRTRNIDTREAYWSYLRRYRRGAHCDDARRRLAYLSAAFEPPPSFAVVEYDVPPPP